MGRRSPGDEPALPARRRRCRRTVDCSRSGRTGARASRNRPQSRAGDAGGSGADAPQDRRGSFTVQGSRPRRRASAAGAATFFDSRALESVPFPNELTMIQITRIVALSTLAAALTVPAWAQRPERGRPREVVPPVVVPPVVVPPTFTLSSDQVEALYDQPRQFIELSQFDRAVTEFDRLIDWKSPRTDAAMYWKAYSLSKMTDQGAALETLAALEKQFKTSRWIKDAKALEVEIRQASGQAVTPDLQNDEELKLLALRGLMQSDPERTLPIIEQMLGATNTPRVKDRALFVLSQSRSSRAREVIGNVAKGTSNPDLQLKAIRYLGIMGGSETRDLLADVYRTSSDIAVKRAILR